MAWPTHVVATGAAALAVDVEVDLLTGAVGLEVQQLRDQRVGDAGVDARAEVDDALGQQVRVDVHDPLTPWVLRDDVGDRVAAHGHLTPIAMTGRAVGMTCSKSSTIASTKP
jgi:hypothetical protein